MMQPANVTSDVEYLYNDFSQVTTEYQQHGAAVNISTSPKVQYTYVNGTGNIVRRTSCTYPDGKVLSYGYGSGANDKLSRVEKLTWDSTDVVDYAYLGLGQVVVQKYPEPSTDVVYTLDHGTANAYAGMDEFGRIIDLQWLQGTSKLAWLKYGYDRASNRKYRRDEVSRNNSAKFDELYTYDGLNRLTVMARGELNNDNNALVGSPTLTQSWNLDSTGNWHGFDQDVVDALEQTRAHSEINEITGITEAFGDAWPTPGYDDNGNTTSFPDPRDLESSLTATYDAWNRLVKLEDSGTVAEYQYDGRHRRIIKIADSVTRHYYFNNRWQVLEERVDSATSADRQYVWGHRYMDNLVLRDRTSERLYGLQDALFSVVALTDDTGDVKERFAYQSYGKSEALNPDFTTYSGTNYRWEYRFTGRELDLESGLQINRNRYLHLELGRWLTRDPIGYRGGWNLYEYVGSSPVGFWDPYGLHTVDDCANRFAKCMANAKIFYEKCLHAAGGDFLEREACQIQFFGYKAICAAGYAKCIATSDEGLITISVVVAVGTIALAIYLWPVAVATACVVVVVGAIASEGQAEEVPELPPPPNDPVPPISKPNPPVSSPQDDLEEGWHLVHCTCRSNGRVYDVSAHIRIDPQNPGGQARYDKVCKEWCKPGEVIKAEYERPDPNYLNWEAYR